MNANISPTKHYLIQVFNQIIYRLKINTEFLSDTKVSFYFVPFLKLVYGY